MPTTVRANIDKATKQPIADEQRLPSEIKVPNKETEAAFAELEAGKGKSFNSFKELLADLDADD